ncbi:MAG TPA: hypothetical protein VGB17_04775 [Pyrinomonadaceae bacterium]
MIAVLSLLILSQAFDVLAFDDPTQSGTTITNQATATYADEGGTTYGTASPTITVTVLAVATLVVTPDETESSASVAAHERINRIFRICNTGNTLDLYTITAAEVSSPASLFNLYFDNDASGTLTETDALIRLNESLSKRVGPGSCTGVIAVVETNDAATNSRLSIRLTARSSVNATNGIAEDDGTIINQVGAGPRLTSPSDSSLPPSKLVNGSAQTVVGIGNPFTYTIAFRNSGEVTARSVLVTDDLPAGIEYLSGTLRLETRNLSDADDADEGHVSARQVIVRLAEVAPGQVVNISFKARLSGNAPAATGVANFVSVTGQNVSPTPSTQAVVVIDPFGIVFSARAGSASPIPGAQVEVLLDQNGTPLSIPNGNGFVPNPQNVNPFITGSQGRFNFVLAPGQLGDQSSSTRYFIKVTADGYATRLLEITPRPTHTGLYALTVRALDGQKLAGAGGFELVNEDVRIEDLAALAFNIPMFEQSGLEISKSADRQRVEIGDVVTYRIELHNPSAAPVNDVTIADRLPVSFNYVQGTARLVTGSTPERVIEPQTNGPELLFRIGTVGAGATARLLYRVRIGANAREGEQTNIAAGSGTFPSGERIATATARASVMVGAGVFSTRQVIVGRVFFDANGNGKFDDGDKPMPGVRLYLSSGQSVMTDSEGLYNFPSLGDGPQVLSLDPLSLTDRYALADDGTLAGRSWTRLLRTPLGGGALLRQNFALTNNQSSQHKAATGGPQGDDAIARRTDSLPAPNSNKTIEAKTDKNSSEPLSQAGTAQPASSVENRPTAAGTYTFVSNEMVEPVAPGTVRVVSPSQNSVVMAPAMQLEASVALSWAVKLEVNGRAVSDKNIGSSRLDQKNNVATYTFVGINLRPGPNSVRVTPVSPEGAAGRAEELTVMGRGPARRLELVSEKTEIQADGRDAAILRVRAYDQWNSPALDDQVTIETSMGQLLRVSEDTVASNSAARQNAETQNSSASGRSSISLGGAQSPLAAEQINQPRSQLVATLNGGEAQIRLVASGAPGEARIHAQLGQMEARAGLRITPESRPTILVGLAEVTVGQSVPEVNLHGEQGNYRSRLSFFYNGRVRGNNILTLTYDSQRPINRTAGRDRLFQLDPLDRAYPLFGDSSTRYEAAQSNSKLYARLDHNRSYAMFGDFEADMESLALAGYARKLTGVKLHLENSEGDFLTVTGARPDTAFARDVFPAGGTGLLALSHAEILPGSETVFLEVRDRRNPEIIISRETLMRSVDYNLDPATGELFFLRYISAFDYNLNLVQLVATYEHRADALSTAVYTARGRKRFEGLGLQLGFSAVMQRQEETGSFLLGGIDGEQSLPHKGAVRFAFARSQGELVGSGNFFESNDSEHNGNAYHVELVQPFPRYEAVLRARYSSATAGFLNPYGATVTPGSRRGEVGFDFKPLSSSTLHFGLMSERNRTPFVDNTRLTLSAVWEQVVNERLRFRLGYDHRSLDDELSGHSTESNLVSASAEMKLTDKLEVSVKREQNLGEADPTYPNQTTLAATYQVNQWAKLFLTQRLASAPIMPIGDFSNTGFASTGSRRETAFGVESRLGKYSSMTGRYQLENGINGTDSFAVIGLQNRLPVTPQLSLELGFERGFHLAGEGESFNSATVGFGWQPNEEFRANARYELRHRGGLGQVLALGAAGRLSEGITTLARFQMARTNFEGRGGSSIDAMAALAIRPLKTDRAGLLFSYTHRSLDQDGWQGRAPTSDRLDSLATDGYFQATKELELYGRAAVRLNANGQDGLAYVQTLTYLTQGRAQYRLSRRFDMAGEARMLFQPSSETWRSSYGTELGFWAIPDLRLGLGYNFTRAGEPGGWQMGQARRGFYFTISSKLSNLFNLFGTEQNGLVGVGKEQTEAQPDQKK